MPIAYFDDASQNYGETKNAAHIATHITPESAAHIDRNTQQLPHLRA
jgi:hypothetical protein